MSQAVDRFEQAPGIEVAKPYFLFTYPTPQADGHRRTVWTRLTERPAPFGWVCRGYVASLKSGLGMRHPAAFF